VITIPAKKYLRKPALLLIVQTAVKRLSANASDGFLLPGG
jgi:hypothetical protein